MRTLLLLALIALAVYVLYSNGLLSQVIPNLPPPDSTPVISVTIVSPYRAGVDATPGASDPLATAQAPIGEPATATPLPPQPTLPPPTIIVQEPAPTLAVSTTPTPASDFPLKVETPLDGETVHVSPWLVVGQTQADALVSVNDVIGFANAEGRFSLSVPLQEGVNVLEVLASNAAGEQVFVILTVLYQP